MLAADVVGCSSSVPIRLTDTDLDLDPGLAETVEVKLGSSSETSPETVLLTEDGPSSGVFTGFLPTGVGTPTVDGVLQVADGDWVTGSYLDADDGTGLPKTSVYTIDVDCTGPTIAPVSLTNLTDSSARVVWTTSEAATGFVEWGTTPALGSMAASGGSATNHSVTIGDFAECSRIYFRVNATDAYGNTTVADGNGTPFGFNTWGVPGLFDVDDFEVDGGWTLEGEWEIGAPQGLGSAPGDPTAAFSGSQVLGHDLSGLGTEPGDFEPMSSEAAISPVIDGSSFVNTQIKFRRRLNIGPGSFAYIDVKDSGGSWNLVYQTSVAGIQDSDWVDMFFDISSFADSNPALQVRFRERSFLASSFASGWNVDDLAFRDGTQPALAACGGCAGEPAFNGLVSAIDDDPCSDSGVMLTWSPAPGWGTGTTGTYAVYRDSAPGFTPGPGNLLISGLTATEWTDPNVPDDTDVYYLVRAENDETCAGGPQNGGLTDTNSIYIAARDDTAQAAPGDVGATLFVDPVAAAHARLTWSTASGAATYAIRRSGQPDANFAPGGQTASTQFDDLDVLPDGQTWYYLVQAVDACGNPGP